MSNTGQDFGFTLEDSDEISIDVSEDNRVQEMMDVIVPFLNALKKAPEKDTIKWPNRVEVLDALLQKLYNIQSQESE